MHRSAHTDTFARDRLPPPEQWPDLLFELPALQFPERLNCASELLDAWVARGLGDRSCLIGARHRWTYAQLQAEANRIAHVLVQDMGVRPGNRVLLRGGNSPMLAACWFAIQKAGAIAVATMPLLRARELGQIIDKAQVSHALCDAALGEELLRALAEHPVLERIVHYHADAADGLEALAAGKPPQFQNVDTASDDVCLIAFTSGTTGQPKGTMHFHRDVLAICHCWPPHCLKATADDVFIGSPPLAFTFGLGGLLVFPMWAGASVYFPSIPYTPEAMVKLIGQVGATICYTAPTFYRQMAAFAKQHGIGRLRLSVSAGEGLPDATRQLWKDASGLELSLIHI